jgi:hypothetical protein
VPVFAFEGVEYSQLCIRLSIIDNGKFDWFYKKIWCSLLSFWTIERILCRTIWLPTLKKSQFHFFGHAKFLSRGMSTIPNYRHLYCQQCQFQRS